MEMMGVGLDLMSILITFVILVGVLLGKKNSMNEYFPVMLLLNAMTVLADMGALVYMGSADTLIIFKVAWILQFSFLVCEVAGFNLYVDTMISYRAGGKKPLYCVVPFVIAAILIILWITSMETGFFYRISDGGIVTRSRYFWLVELVVCMIGVFDLARVIFNQLMHRLDGSIALGIYIFEIIPLAALPLAESVGNMSFLFAAITVSFVTMYISIHVRQESVSLEKMVNDEKMQTELMLSQLQPHFIFNTLTTVKYLCNKNPQLAVEAITNFTNYLRRNLNTISDNNLVKFKEELEHTKTYLWLEQLRFSKNLRVEYSVDVEDFLVPPLSLQPIVENAVKHGVTKKIGGGTITISVRETEGSYRITVSDDGVGFDKQEIPKDGEAHIGINDVRKRLHEMNGSTISIVSEVGVGTTVTYEIKKDEE